MASRLIREEILESKRFNELTPMAQNFFFRLMLVVDDYGRFYTDSMVLRNKVYPRMENIRIADIGRWLNETEKTIPPMIRRYNVADEQFLEIANFGQRKNRMESKHPAPPWDSPSRVRSAPARNRSEENRSEEKENIIKEKKINILSKGAIWSKIQRIYPKFNGEVIANREFLKALDREIDKGRNESEVLKAMLQAVTAYAGTVETWDFKRKDYTWSAAVFFRDGHYSDDPETWYRGDIAVDDEMVTLQNGRKIPKSKAVWLDEYGEWVEASGAV